MKLKTSSKTYDFTAQQQAHLALVGDDALTHSLTVKSNLIAGQSCNKDSQCGEDGICNMGTCVPDLSKA